ncbi:hypothetical protein PLICRDRAFT_42531 [Plicaturopsis crispa FD-325 SS-3]|nr:hypothetical protein PLICRDRAFT_42531 [Plicaturopsis crispa FD-325 SS-3]
MNKPPVALVGAGRDDEGSPTDPISVLGVGTSTGVSVIVAAFFVFGALSDAA